MFIILLLLLFHGDSSESDIGFINKGILTEDTVIYLSISDSVNKINDKIASIPHNLNGHNLAFIFVVPEGYENGFENDPELGLESNYYEYSMNVGDQCIKFSNFFSGTLFVFGDFLNGSKIYQNNEFVPNFMPFTKKSVSQINDPFKYDGIVPSVYIGKLYKEIDQPQSIDDIITYNSDDAKNGIVESYNLNKIIIKGTCLNQNYSVMCFSDVTAKTYIKNLKFVNTLKADKDGLIDIVRQMNSRSSI